MAKNAAAKKWRAAVNNLGKYGYWEFEICNDLTKLRTILEQHVEPGATFLPFRVVKPTRQTAWRTCVPLTSLRAAAGKFSEEQLSLDRYDEWHGEWVEWDGAPKFEPGMFVARVHGRSMEPDIRDGAYCLFRPPRAGTRQGKTLLVWHSGISDPHTGGQYTVKIYESKKVEAEDRGWQHLRITLKPRNPEFEPIILEPREEGDVRVIAEFVGVIEAAR